MDTRRRPLFAAIVALAMIVLVAPAPALASGAKKEKEAPASYTPITTLTATVVRPNGKRGVLTVDLGLDVPDKALNEKVQKILPRIRASMLQATQIYAAGMIQGPPPNVDYLSRELQRQVDLTVGRPGAKLLIGSVILN